MAANEIHVGDIATRFLITIKDGDDTVDLSTATLMQINFHKPDASALTKNGSLYTDGLDGKYYWATTATTDLDQEGIWKLQGYIEFNNGGKFHTDIHTFQVHPNL